MFGDIHEKACIFFIKNTLGLEMETIKTFTKNYGYMHESGGHCKLKIIVNDKNTLEKLEFSNYAAMYEYYELEEMLLIDWEDQRESLEAYGITGKDIQRLKLLKEYKKL